MKDKREFDEFDIEFFPDGSFMVPVRYGKKGEKICDILNNISLQDFDMEKFTLDTSQGEILFGEVSCG